MRIGLVLSAVLVALVWGCGDLETRESPLRAALTSADEGVPGWDEVLQWEAVMSSQAVEVSGLLLEPADRVRLLDLALAASGEDVWLRAVAEPVGSDGWRLRPCASGFDDSGRQVSGQTLRDAGHVELRPSADPESRRLIDERGAQLGESLAHCVAGAGPLVVHVVDDAPLAIWVDLQASIVFVNRAILPHIRGASGASGAAGTAVREYALEGESPYSAACQAAWAELCPAECTRGVFDPECEPLFASGDAFDCNEASDGNGGPGRNFCLWVLDGVDPEVTDCIGRGVQTAEGRASCINEDVQVDSIESLRRRFQSSGARYCGNALEVCAGNSEHTVEFRLEDHRAVRGAPAQIPYCADDLPVRCNFCRDYSPLSGCGDCFDLMRPETIAEAPLAACVSAALYDPEAGPILPTWASCVNSSDLCIDPDLGRRVATYEQLIVGLPGFFVPGTRERCVQRLNDCIGERPPYRYEVLPPNYDPSIHASSEEPEKKRCPG